jgi:DEAD/DEAH box helicase domain-containing protein
MDHVRCAAFELPFDDGDRFGSVDVAEPLAYLRDQGIVHQEGSRWHWVADSYPANTVSLRSIAEGNFVVVDATDGGRNIIAEVDYSSAAVTIYEGAIYLVQASPWQVEKLDWVGRKAYVRRTSVDYYTDAIDYTKLKVLDEFDRDADANGHAAHGEVHVVRRVAGYKKIRYYTHENIGYGNVNLPDQEMHTTALWWELRPETLERAFPNRWIAIDGFLGAAYALHHIAALVSLSELRDIGRSVGDGNAGWSAVVDANGRGSARSLDGQPYDVERGPKPFRPAVHLYDAYPGGIGISAPLYDMRAEIVARAIDLVAHCACKDGCPACIGPVLPPDAKLMQSPKQAALTVLRLFVDGEKPECARPD